MPEMNVWLAWEMWLASLGTNTEPAFFEELEAATVSYQTWRRKRQWLDE